MNREGKNCVLYPRVSTEMQVEGFQHRALLGKAQQISVCIRAVASLLVVFFRASICFLIFWS